MSDCLVCTDGCDEPQTFKYDVCVVALKQKREAFVLSGGHGHDWLLQSNNWPLDGSINSELTLTLPAVCMHYLTVKSESVYMLSMLLSGYMLTQSAVSYL